MAQPVTRNTGACSSRPCRTRAARSGARKSGMARSASVMARPHRGRATQARARRAIEEEQAALDRLKPKFEEALAVGNLKKARSLANQAAILGKLGQAAAADWLTRIGKYVPPLKVRPGPT